MRNEEQMYALIMDTAKGGRQNISGIYEWFADKPQCS